MAALSRWLTAPRVRAFMRTPVGPNLSAAVFPELTSETSLRRGRRAIGFGLAGGQRPIRPPQVISYMRD